MQKIDEISHPVLSVIIGTYNRPELLERCLDSLLVQSSGFSVCEILVVDGSTNDATHQLVDGYTARESSIRYIYEVKPGHSNARNRGYYESKGDYLIYLDDDTMMPVEYLENVLDVVQKHAPDIIGGPIYPYYTSPKPRWFRDEFEIRKYEEQSGFSTRCSISGGNFIIGKSVLASLGLFDPNYGITKGRLNMLDDAKVLALYRSQTSPDQQKVYYSLECYVKHHTPREKMRLFYILKRQYMTGLMAFRMYLEIDGKPDHKRGILPFRRVFKTSINLIRDIFRVGFLKVNYLGFLAELLSIVGWNFGYLVAQMQYLFGSKAYRKTDSSNQASDAKE
jgi:glucosyl-dolichyl phosphate glucuronosyltransferase